MLFCSEFKILSAPIAVPLAIDENPRADTALLSAGLRSVHIEIRSHIDSCVSADSRFEPEIIWINVDPVLKLRGEQETIGSDRDCFAVDIRTRISGSRLE